MDFVREATALTAHVAAAEWPFLVVGIALHVLRRASRARAWQQMLLAVEPESEVRFRDALGVCLAAVGLSSVAPLRGGELVRIPLIKRRRPAVSCGAATATLGVEALLDLVAGAMLVGAALALGALPALAGGAGATAAGMLPFTRAEVGLVARPRRAWQAATSALEELRRSSFRLAKPRLILYRVAPWLGLSWLLRIAAIACFLQAFSIEPSVATALGVLCAQLAAGALPLPWVAIGAEQALVALVLAREASATQAVAFGLGMHAATTLANTALGLPALAWLAPGSGLRKLIREVRPQRTVVCSACAAAGCDCTS